MTGAAMIVSESCAFAADLVLDGGSQAGSQGFLNSPHVGIAVP
jgi:hypothetical protein